MLSKVALATNKGSFKSYCFLLKLFTQEQIKKLPKASGLYKMNKHKRNIKLSLMESMLYRLSANFTYSEVYEIFLAENDIHVLDEILEYFISIQNFEACSAIKELVKEKCLKN